MNKKIETTNPRCMICGDHTHPLLDTELHVTYDVCDNCHFIYKQKPYHVDNETEKNRYLKHHNDELNIGYKTYLEQFIKLHVRPLKSVKTILDFGSGPYPMLKKLLEGQGYDVQDFDPFFNDDLSYRKHKYDLIILTEVLEHIFDPLSSLEHLIPLLNKGGRLMIMTQFRNMNQKDFLDWWYRRDITHVSFFHQETFQFISTYLKLEIIENNERDFILFKKAW